jgi:hypothetical protein
MTRAGGLLSWSYGFAGNVVFATGAGAVDHVASEAKREKIVSAQAASGYERAMTRNQESLIPPDAFLER